MFVKRRTSLLLGLGALGLVAVLGLGAFGALGGNPETSWSAPRDVPAHVAAAGLQLLGKEGLAEHIHPHLSVTVNGRAITVPAHLGINTAVKPETYAQVHTHDTSGIIHVESPVVEPFYLGQVFEEWGVTLRGNQVAQYVRGQAGVRIATYVDGSLYRGNPEFLQLKNKQQISIAITTDGSAPRPAPSFTYPAGY